MQTFLPYSDFVKSAEVLDSKRLFKQVVEARQILNVLTENTKKAGWRNHPAVLQWRGYTSALKKYTTCCIAECYKRGIRADNEEEKLSLINAGSSDYLPDWLGDPRIHSTHRSRLLCKGYADSVCDGIKKALKIKSIDDYLESKLGKTKNQLKYQDVIGLQRFYFQISEVPLVTNHYLQFSWNDDPAAEYIWPNASV